MLDIYSTLHVQPTLHCKCKLIHSQVLQDLRKPETLHIINQSQTWFSDINQCRKTIRSGQKLVETLYSSSSPIQVFSIPRHPERIEIRFKNFGTKDIYAVGHIESVLVIKGQLRLAWNRPASKSAVTRDISEGFRANASTITKRGTQNGGQVRKNQDALHSTGICIPTSIH